MSEHTFSVREAAQLLDLTPTQVRSFARAGLDHPEIAGTDEARFGFRDLVVLRMAAGLKRAHVPSRRISGALARLRASGGEVAGLQLEALGAHVVVRDGEELWQADSGQFQLDFVEGSEGTAAPNALEVSESSPSASSAPGEVVGAVAAPAHAPEIGDARAALARAATVETEDPAAAVEIYRRVIAADPSLWEAHTGLGFLLQQAGRLLEAAESYRAALDIEADATVAFNLGVALDDAGRLEEARSAYERALELDPGLADAHFNLSCLSEKVGDRPAALRHMIAYRERARAE